MGLHRLIHKTLCLAAACLLSASYVAFAQKTIHVPADQSTIQGGIDAAVNGDTVLVGPGTYYENIDFKGKAITVTSSGGAAATIIDGGYKGGVATVVFANGETRSSVISGFTIRGGGDDIFNGNSDGGVYVGESSPTIAGNTITSNYCHNIDVESGAAAILNNEVSGVLQNAGGPGSQSNECSFGSGVNLQGAPIGVSGLYSTITGNTIENNLTGSAINLWTAPNVLIMNNTIRNNTSSYKGGAYIEDGSTGVAIVQNLIYGNSSCGGAIANSSPVLIANNIIVDNIATPSIGSDCAPITQIYPQGSGGSGPQTVIVNNIISGSTSDPAVNCDLISSSTPSEADQPSFENNILWNAGGPFFGSHCVDVSAKYNNIVAVPQFVSPSTGNYHLLGTSPAVDSGQNSVIETYFSITGKAFTTDFDGNQRIHNYTGKGCIIDMGAYEYPSAVSSCGTTETLQSSVNPSAFGQSVIFTAQLYSTNGPPTGDVQFLDGSTILSTQTVSATGAATFSSSSLSVGNHTITANYQPSGSFSATSANLTQVVSPYPTVTTLISSLNPSIVGQTVTFTATVGSGYGIPTGTIAFAEAGTNLATVSVSAAGTAVYATSALAAGPHSISATYRPTGSFAESAAGVSMQTLPITSPTGPIAPPVISLAPGTYTSAQTVSITDATPGAAIYYTTNGTNPTTSSSIYSAPLTVSSTETLKAIAVVGGGAQMTVSFGYHDLAPCCGNSNPLPNPWAGSPNTLFLGDFTLATSSDPDESAILFANTGTKSVTLGQGVTVTSGSNVLQLWDTLIGVGGLSIAPGVNAILSATTNNNFDGSEIPLVGSSVDFILNGLGYSVVDNNCSTCVSKSILAGSSNGPSNETVPWTTVATIGGTSSATAAVYTIDLPQPTSTSLTCSPTSAYPGQSILFSIGVSSSNGTPTGTVSLSGLGTSLISLPLTAGAASYSQKLPIGTYTVTATYNPATGYAASSATCTETVAGDPTTTTLASSLNPAPYGQPVTFTSTLSASNAAPANLWPGYAAFGASISTGVGATPITDGFNYLLANYLGLTPDIRGNSGDQACDVAKRQLFGRISTSDNNNALLTLLVGTNDASFSGPGPYEAVFNLCEQAALSWMGSSATGRYYGSSFPSLPTGWALDNTYNLAVPVLGLKSTTQGATSSWPIATTGGPIAIWYRIVDGNGGTFTYSVDGGTPVSVNNYTSPAIHTINGSTDSVGVVFAKVPAGQHTVTITVTSATSSGNLVSIVAVGTSPQTLLPQGPNVFVGGVCYQLNDANSAATAAYDADTLANVNAVAQLGFGAEFVNVRQYLHGTPADMYDQLHPNNLGHQELEQAFQSVVDIPIGVSVSFLDGTTVLATEPAINGSASYTTSTLAPGTHSMTAVFSGTSTLAASTSTVLAEVIQAPPVSITLTSAPNPSVAFQSIQLNAQVSATGNGVQSTLSGTVTFTTAPVTLVLGTSSISSSGFATLQLSGLPAQTFTVIASFSGTATYQGISVPVSATSAAVVQIVDKAPTTLTLTALPIAISQGQSTTIAATIADAPSTQLPAGNITFNEPSTGTVLGTGPLTANGIANLSVSTLAPGTHQLLATYAGSTNFLPSTSNLVTVTVGQSDFTVAFTPPTLTLQTETTATAPFALTSLGVFADTLDLECGNLPQYTSCTFASPSVQLNAGQTLNLSVAIHTEVLAASLDRPAGPTRRSLPPMAVAALLPFAFLLKRKARTQVRLFVLMLVAFLAANLLSGCTTIVYTPPHTAPGSYTVTLTATGLATGVSHSAPLTLNVTP